MFNLLRNRVDASCLMPMVRLKVPVRVVRSNEFFVVAFHRIEYIFQGPVNELLRMFNHFSQFYVGSVTRGDFRSKVQVGETSNPVLTQSGLSSVNLVLRCFRKWLI